MEIEEIWRYPVKSMLGERLQQARITPAGLVGDRFWAVVDADSGVSLSAKRYPNLLQCAARTERDEVLVTLPDGATHRVDAPQLAEALSAMLGRDVQLRAAAQTSIIRHEFPTEIAKGEGEPFLWEPHTEAFFDSAPLHLITTATLDHLQQLAPQSDFSYARFRANFLVRCEGSGFVEDEWTGRELMLGEISCAVLRRKPRCVMVIRPQGDLPDDVQVLRTTLDHNEGNAGVELRGCQRRRAALW